MQSEAPLTLILSPLRASVCLVLEPRFAKGRGFQAASLSQFPGMWLLRTVHVSVPRGSDAKVAPRPLASDRALARACCKSGRVGAPTPTSARISLPFPNNSRMWASALLSKGGLLQQALTKQRPELSAPDH